MTDETIDASTVSDSAGDSSVDTSTDTASTQAHTTSAADDATSHIEWLKSNTDKLSEEDRKVLDRTFQPDYTRRVNSLNLLKQNASTAFKEAGIELPENWDPFGADSGKQLKELISGTIGKEIAPVKEAISKAETTQNIQREISRARQVFPEVNENLEEAIRRVDSDPDLTRMAAEYNGAAIPYVLRYAALEVVKEKQAKEIKDLRSKLDGAKVVAKVGTSSTKSTGTGGKSGSSGNGKIDGPQSPMQRESAFRRAAAAALESNK